MFQILIFILISFIFTTIPTVALDHSIDLGAFSNLSYIVAIISYLQASLKFK